MSEAGTVVCEIARTRVTGIAIEDENAVFKINVVGVRSSILPVISVPSINAMRSAVAMTSSPSRST